MRVLLAVHHFLPRYSAGAELYTYRLARWLLAQGYAVEVVCVEEVDHLRPADLTARYELFDDIPVWRLSLGMAGAARSWAYDHPLINSWLREHLRSNRPDLVHLHSGYLLGAGVLKEAYDAAVPSLVTLHDFWFLCPQITLLRGDGRVCAQVPADAATCAWCLNLSRNRYRLADQVSGGAAGFVWQALAGDSAARPINDRRSVLRQALGLASMVLAPSRFLASHFADIVAHDRLRVVRLGIDTSALHQIGRPSESGPLRLGYIGQIAPHKGVDVLARAVAALPAGGRQWTLSIHGDFAQHPRYGASLRRLLGDDPRVTLAGRFDNAAIAQVFCGLDALVVPSIWYENSPLVILEAQAASRPVITSAMGGMAELVRDELDGLTFRPGDAADLARQIQRLREEPQLLARLSAATQAPPSIADELQTLAQLYAQAALGVVPHAVEVA